MSFFDDFNNQKQQQSAPQSNGENENNVTSENADSTDNATVEAVSPAVEENKAETKQSYDYNSIDFWEGIATVKPKKKPISISLILLMLLVLLICTAFLITAVKGRGWVANLISGGKNIEFTLPIAETPALDDEYYDEDGRYTTEGIAQAITPSVVSVEIYGTESGLAVAGQGSGIIMTEDGYIVTNAHVVSSATKIKVVLYDNTEYEGVLIGIDTASDIAVVKISAQGLQPAQFGDSTAVSVGEDVVTIGSPAGYYGSVTKGIVSGLDRQIKAENSTVQMSCIQIDAPINPGNSGGALVNMWGQVIGITSSKLSPTNYEGIGFAISINSAKPIIENLMEYGYVKNRVRVGITFYSVSETTAEMYDTKAGLCVVTIDPDCDIANTDLQPNDIITALDGTPVSDSTSVKEFLADKEPGDEITASVYRPSATGEGSEFEITFKLMEDTGSLIEADTSSTAE